MLYSQEITDLINIALLNDIINREGFKNTDLAGLLGVHANTLSRWRKNYLKMPVESLILLCQVLKVDIKDILWFENKGRENVLTRREIDMIRRDNQSSRVEICKYFEITEDYLRQIKSRGDIYLAEYSCIPPLSVKML